MISNEAFMKNLSWLDKLKIRGSYGLTGNDRFNTRWGYITQWGSGGAANLVSTQFSGKSPYTWYYEDIVGNADLQWETSLKSNIGFEFAMNKNMFSLDFDYFKEFRDNVLIYGADRKSVPSFYGIDPPDFNSGQVEVKGYELVLGFNYRFNNDIRVHANFSLTDARDVILYKEDPVMAPDYQKDEGYAIGQPRMAIPGDILESWDDIYMATPLSTGQAQRRVGYYDVVDFNNDGIYDGTYDDVPQGYTNRPQRTWNLTTSVEYKGISLMAQLYGTQNAHRLYSTATFVRQTYLFYEHRLDYWSKDNPDATKTLDAWSNTNANTDPLGSWYDASVLRLKTVELAYTFKKRVCEKIKVTGLRIFANGNNLFFWSDMPDDREFNSLNNSGTNYRGDYPTMKRFNFGLNLNF
jgi:hypothetical protein